MLGLKKSENHSNVVQWIMTVMQLVMKTCLAGDTDVLVRTDHDFKTEIMSKFVSNGHELMTQHPVEVATRFTCIQTVIIPWILIFCDIDN